MSDAPKPIFVNEFNPPREPARIKPVLNVGARGVYLGRNYYVIGKEPGDKALISYVDELGVIHTLSIPEAVL
jgi:hypothetical protein